MIANFVLNVKTAQLGTFKDVYARIKTQLLGSGIELKSGLLNMRITENRIDYFLVLIHNEQQLKRLNEYGNVEDVNVEDMMYPLALIAKAP